MWDSPYQASRFLTESSGVRASSMADTHVGFAHFRVFRDRLVVAFSENAPARQDGNATAEVLDHAEIVLDHQYSAIGRNPLDQCADAINVLVAHAGSGLIEQQQLGIECERGRD